MPKITLEVLHKCALDLTQSPFFQIFILTVLFDILTGWYKAAKNKKLDSKTSTLGLIKHLLIICLLFVIGIYARALNQIIFSILVFTVFIGSYGLSLLENLEASGVWFPEWFKELFKQMRDRKLEDTKIKIQNIGAESINVPYILLDKEKDDK